MRDEFYEWMRASSFFLKKKNETYFHWPIITKLLPEAQLTGRFYEDDAINFVFHCNKLSGTFNIFKKSGKQ